MAARQCPHCRRWSLKDDNCNYIVCGRDNSGVFRAGMGCGRPWCYLCGQKLCGRVYREDGTVVDPNEDHNHVGDAEARARCDQPGFCQGGAQLA